MMRGLVLSLFPGLDLLGRVFEEQGFSVVRGPDRLWGGDVRKFHVPAGRFDGVIGGPPCQRFSTLMRLNEKCRTGSDLVGEFVRLVREAAPTWVCMEEVRGVEGHPDIPGEWFCTRLQDYQCGGLTMRRRSFWTWPFPVWVPEGREGRGCYSVLASGWRDGRDVGAHCKRMMKSLTLEQAAALQGHGDLVGPLREVWGQRSVRLSGRGQRQLGVHMLGNGVPRAMADVVVRSLGLWLDGVAAGEGVLAGKKGG